jgi:phage gpG-like protein
VTTLGDLRAASKDPGPLLESIGLLMAGRTQAAFRDQGRGGNQWPGRGVPNRIGILEDLRAGRTPPERRFEARPAGIDTGRLRSSIAYRVEGNSVVIGSNLSYASDVQRGSPKTIQVQGDLRKALAAWLRSLTGDRRAAMRRAFGYLFHVGALTVKVPARPFVLLTEDDRKKILALARAYYTGGFAK